MRHNTRSGLAMAILLALIMVAPQVTAQPTPVTSPGCTVGSASIGDSYFPTAGNGGYDVQHYDLDLEIDVAGREILSATVTIDALALTNLCAFNLDFEGLTIDDIAVDGASVGYTRRGKELTIMPDLPLMAGDSFSTSVRYHGTPILGGMLTETGDLPVATTIVDDDKAGIGGADPDENTLVRGGWFVTDDEIFVISQPTGSRYWYPLNEHPADKATYTASYTVSKPYIVVANGTPSEPIDNGESTTFRWTSRDPMHNYGTTFHAGLLDVETLEGPNGLPIRLSFAPTVPEAQREIARQLPKMIEYAESLFGPYPFESAGAIITSTQQGFALETQTIPVYGALGDKRDQDIRPDDLMTFQMTMMHELAHQWFGNSVSLQRWGDIWLNEGFAQYSAHLWLEHTGGREPRSESLSFFYELNLIATELGIPENAAKHTAQDVLDALQDTGQCREDACVKPLLDLLDVETEEDLAKIPASDMLAALESEGLPREEFPGIPVLTGDPGSADLFAATSVYLRGALTMHALRIEIGDEAFFATLQAWTSRYANGNAATADFIAIAEEISGQDLGAFFQKWLYEYDLPELDLED